MYVALFGWVLACVVSAPWWVFVIGALCLMIDNEGFK